MRRFIEGAERGQSTLLPECSIGEEVRNSAATAPAQAIMATSTSTFICCRLPPSKTPLIGLTSS